MDRAEKLGLGVATAGHVLLFGLLSVGFLATPNPLRLERPPVEVQFVDEVGLEATTPKPAETAPATSVAPELGPPEEAAPEPTPAPAEPVAQPAPAPRPSPVPAPKPAPPQPRAKAEPSKAPPRDKPAAKPVPRGSRLGPDFLKGITDKASTTRDTTAINAAIGPREQAALAAELLRQLRPFWRSPTGADVEQLRVVVVARLNRDGSLAGEPRAEAVTGVTPSNRAQADLFAERAVAAVKRAAPYNFPADFYDAWKTIKPRFKKDL
jgi:outer membrane biosynthesis protein TonB